MIRSAPPVLPLGTRAYRGRLLTPVQAAFPGPARVARAGASSPPPASRPPASRPPASRPPVSRPPARPSTLPPRPAERARLRYIDDAILLVAPEGHIVSAEPAALTSFRGPILDLRPAVLIPGFVDAHLHFPQTRITGSASGPLLEWLDRSVFPEEARFHDPAYAAAVADDFIRRLLLAGTTTSVAFSSAHPTATDQLFDALHRTGLRGVAGLTLMDQNCPEALRLGHREAVPAMRDLIQKWHGKDEGRLRFVITPRFAPSCSRALLEAAADLADEHQLFIQTHIAEQPAEAEAALRACPWGTDYLDIYDRLGLLGPRTLFAHAIHLSDREWDRIAEAGARVAHCPDSNFFLGSGRMALDEPRRRGIPVALGSDIGAGRSFDMRRAMSHAFDNALCLGNRLSPAELFTLATLGGAEALDLADHIGTLEAGKEADFLAVRCPDHITTEAEILAQLAFASEESRVLRVYVRGAQVHPIP
ncbi:guanine deaminase [Chondromyces crocatus]|uniref:Guanine deaminase n=1 Tax=Chondromyces crocatus TaxID=52 RepID=A0A0K1EBU6_CHOCO|nr:guanine deaminase [Chondromyces crocatus]AKT38048.1 guanine deaminase [Chondromyces crocatus]